MQAGFAMFTGTNLDASGSVESPKFGLSRHVGMTEIPTSGLTEGREQEQLKNKEA